MFRWFSGHRARWLLIAAATTFAALSSCDQRETLITGVGAATDSLASTFIQAFFEKIMGPDPTELSIV